MSKPKTKSVKASLIIDFHVEGNFPKDLDAEQLVRNHLQIGACFVDTERQIITSSFHNWSDKYKKSFNALRQVDGRIYNHDWTIFIHSVRFDESN